MSITNVMYLSMALFGLKCIPSINFYSMCKEKKKQNKTKTNKTNKQTHKKTILSLASQCDLRDRPQTL